MDIPLKLLVSFRNKRRQFTDRRTQSYHGCSLLNLLVSVGYGRHVRFDCIQATLQFTLVHCWTRRTKRSRLKLAGQDKSRFLSEEQRLKKKENKKRYDCVTNCKLHRLFSRQSGNIQGLSFFFPFCSSSVCLTVQCCCCHLFNLGCNKLIRFNSVVWPEGRDLGLRSSSAGIGDS